MAEKNYTEYERDFRDFEKKPLAKDRETLIFPPESDIKGSDKQDASVLPVAPKLSMRKEAQSIKEDPDYTPGCPACEEALDMGATYEEAHFSDVPYYWDLIDTAEERALLEQCIEKYKREKLNKESSTESLKKIAINDKILTSTKKTARIVAISDDIVFWVSIDGEKDFGSDFVEDIEPFEEHEPHEPFEEEGLGPGGVCTCSKCGFVMTHERGVPCYAVECPKCGAKMGRGQGEPIEGITKEIPMEETIELASKNKRKKKAGTWSLPFTPTNATVLENTVNGLKNNDISVHEAKETLSAVYGDDKLFDDLQELINSISSRAADVIRDHVSDLLGHYEASPEDFEEELDPEAKEILERIVKEV